MVHQKLFGGGGGGAGRAKNRPAGGEPHAGGGGRGWERSAVLLGVPDLHADAVQHAATQRRAQR